MNTNGNLALAVLVWISIGAVSVMAVHAQEAKTPSAYLIAETDVTDRAAFQKYESRRESNPDLPPSPVSYKLLKPQSQEPRNWPKIFAVCGLSRRNLGQWRTGQAIMTSWAMKAANAWMSISPIFSYI